MTYHCIIVPDFTVFLFPFLLHCTSHFHCIFASRLQKLYVMERADNMLLFISPVTGEITKTVEIDKSLTNVVYNPDDRNIISMRADGETGKYYIEVYNPDTGDLLSSSQSPALMGTITV